MTDAKKKARNKYNSKRQRITIDFYPTESDLWEHLSKQDNKQGYLKDLIRKDMADYCESGILKQKEKLDEYCKANGYEVTDCATVVGDRKTDYKMLMKLLENAKGNGIKKIVMLSKNRVVGTIDVLEEIKKAFNESGVVLETLGGQITFGDGERKDGTDDG